MFRFILCALLFAAYGQPPTGLAENEIPATRNVAGENGQAVKFRVETVAADLEVPWAKLLKHRTVRFIFQPRTATDAAARQRKTTEFCGSCRLNKFYD